MTAPHSPAVDTLRECAPEARPRIAVVLGSGWSGLTAHVTDAIRIPYAELPGFPRAGVPGHSGELWLGRIGAHEVAASSGRQPPHQEGGAKAVHAPPPTLPAPRLQLPRPTN